MSIILKNEGKDEMKPLIVVLDDVSFLHRLFHLRFIWFLFLLRPAKEPREHGNNDSVERILSSVECVIVVVEVN